MNHSIKYLVAVAALALIAASARAATQQDQPHPSKTGDYIVSGDLSLAPPVQEVRFGRRGFGHYHHHHYGYYGRPRYYISGGPYGWQHSYYHGPWGGYYRPYYGGVRVGPVGVWW